MDSLVTRLYDFLNAWMVFCNQASKIALAASKISVVAEAPRASHGMDRPIELKKPHVLRRAIYAILVATALAAAYLFAVSTGQRQLSVKRGNLNISTVTVGAFEDFIPLRGQITPLNTVYLDAVEGGRVEKILVEDGAEVAVGDLLVRLSNTSLQFDAIAREAEVTQQLNTIKSIELQLEQNRLAHQRALIDADYHIRRLSLLAERRRPLAARGAISRSELEELENELAYQMRVREATLIAQNTDERLQKAQIIELRGQTDTLKRNLHIAKTNLESLNVTATMAGKVTALSVEVGQSLSRGERIGQIDDPVNFKVTALVDEFYIARVFSGQKARLEIAGETHALTVDKVFSQVARGQFEITLAFDDTTPPSIRRGQNVQGRLTLGDASEARIIINGDFLQQTGGLWVFALNDSENVAQRRVIRVGRRNSRYIEVLDGLEEGDKVIVSSYSAYLDADRLNLID